MKRLLMMSASLLAFATVLSSTADAQSIECAAQVPTPPKGQWYYRLIDGRKCWYEGKPMLPKSSLRWPKDPPVETAEAAEVVTPPADVGPSTDGRNVSASPPPDPNIWPAPAVDDTSFESRWQALKPRS